jgi:hypothetical protein
MQSRIAQQLRREQFERMAERADGRMPSVISFSSDRAAAINIPDLAKVPVTENTTELQDADGNYYILFGYSQFGGPDVFR